MGSEALISCGGLAVPRAAIFCRFHLVWSELHAISASALDVILANSLCEVRQLTLCWLHIGPSTEELRACSRRPMTCDAKGMPHSLPSRWR
jgi:hypothetical protein